MNKQELIYHKLIKQFIADDYDDSDLVEIVCQEMVENDYDEAYIEYCHNRLTVTGFYDFIHSEHIRWVNTMRGRFLTGQFPSQEKTVPGIIIGKPHPQAANYTNWEEAGSDQFDIPGPHQDKDH